MMLRLILTLILLSACTPKSRDDNSANAWSAWHEQHLATEEMISAALNGPAGPDYAKAIGIVEASNRTPAQVARETGNLFLLSCREDRAPCRGQGAALGLNRLARAARMSGETADLARKDLSRWYRAGAGAALPSDADRAVCWQTARTDC